MKLTAVFPLQDPSNTLNLPAPVELAEVVKRGYDQVAPLIASLEQILPGSLSICFDFLAGKSVSISWLEQSDEPVPMGYEVVLSTETVPIEKLPSVTGITRKAKIEALYGFFFDYSEAFRAAGYSIDKMMENIKQVLDTWHFR